MARPLRIEFFGALYHVTSRGDRREPIYGYDADREQANALAADLKEAMADLDEAARLQDGARLQKAYVAVATGFSNYSKVIPAQALS